MIHGNRDARRLWQGLDEAAPGARGRDKTVRPRARFCAACRIRRALFARCGEVKADRQHTLCFQCYRAERNRLRAGRLSAAGAGVTDPARPAGRAAPDRAPLMADIELRRLQA
ncbi:MAG TPA: hypothetical protein PLN93_04180 [Vicinamibacterales bacterium]|nr:hypothetical protein [Vicinamibacterales bacterium]HOG29344.1 hypothetical protein [Vicinamibacterales bacterium]HPK71119.1 hypothetical protein [Vicinamibacterales bacterium]HPW21138.1 hypothetical protein [Vicinamibacterales bacterium]